MECRAKNQWGRENPNWRGGRITEPDGRVRVYSPDHPLAIKDGYVYEYRLVAEKKLGRFLRNDEIVHHIDGDPSNNDPENLEVMSQSRHAFIEAAMRKTNPSGIRTSGVRQTPNGKRWSARATWRAKENYLGTFNTKQEATDAVQAFWNNREP